jgi:hypothetical protein
VLSDFLSERARADDYRRHLGIAALIRNDFEQLSDLIRSHNNAVLDGPVEEDLGINRIILYIDDLDRCPAKKVIEVLQRCTCCWPSTCLLWWWRSTRAGSRTP